MKNSIIALLMGVATLGQAQITLKTPPPSPEAEWTQKVGFTTITVAYERPLMRGRKVFGALVPFDQLWRTGAGESTKIKFSEDIEFGGQQLKKGTYSLFSIPNANDWTIILNTDTTGHGAFSYDEKKDILRIKAKSENIARTYEAFSIELGDIMPDYSANIYLNWENTQVKIPLKSNTDKVVMNEINQKINIEKLEDAKFFNSAAQYYFSNKKDLSQALVWSKKSEGMDEENFTYANLSTKILEEQKNYAEAIKSAQKAIALGTKKNMKVPVANWQKKVEEWQSLTGTTTSTSNPKPMENHAGHDMGAMKNEMPTSISQDKIALQPILDAYYAIKDALVKSDATASANGAAQLVASMKAVDMGKMEMKQHMEFMKVNTKIIADAQKIADSKDLKKQRETFQSLSDNFYTMAKGVKLSTEPIYQQYCPMKKAAWLSRESSVKNPYYGSSMLTCGNVQDTIK